MSPTCRSPEPGPGPIRLPKVITTLAILHRVWAGWTAILIGTLIPVAVGLTRIGFPQLGLRVPFTVGGSLIVERF